MAIEMAENSDSTLPLVREICTTMHGQPLSETAWLTSCLRFHVYSNRARASSVCEKVVGFWPDRLLPCRVRVHVHAANAKLQFCYIQIARLNSE